MPDTETSNSLLSDEINLGRYIAVFAQWWRLILACAVLFGLLAAPFALLSPKSYQAEADVIVVRTSTTVNLDSNIRTVSNTDPTTSGGLDQASLRRALLSIADSSDIAQSVFHQLQSQISSLIQKPQSLHQLVDVKNDGDTFQIIVASESPKDAAQIANTWAKEFVDRANSTYGDSPISLDVLSGQMENARSDYDAKEAALVAYLHDSLVQKLQQQRDEKLRILGTLVEGKTTAVQSVITETQQVQIRLLHDYLNSVGNTRSTVFNQQVSARIQKLEDLYTLELKLERLLANAQALRARLAQSPAETSPGNDLALTLLEGSAYTTWADLPVSLQVPINTLGGSSTAAGQMQALEALTGEIQKQHDAILIEIDTSSKALLTDSGYSNLDATTPDPSSPLGDAIRQRVQALLNLTGLENISSYNSEETAVTAAVDQLQKDSNTLGAQIEVENAKRKDLERARDLAWDTYSNLASKVAESQISDVIRSSVVRLGSSAVAPDQPTGRSRLILVLAGAILGLVIGSVLAFVLDYFVGGLTDSNQIKTALDLSTLAEVPSWDNTSPEGNLPGAVMEALRGLRYQLLAERKVSAVMLTSARSGAGVTTLAVNLAQVTAQGGKTVLMIDANLRRPHIHSLFHLDPAPGLSDLLNRTQNEKLNWQSLAHTVNSNLSVLTVGSPVADQAAVLQQESFDLVLHQAKADFDLVIIDAPPIEGVIDSIEIARAVDGILLVVDATGAHRTSVLKARDRLSGATAPILGVVLNRAGYISKPRSEGKAQALDQKTSVWSGVRSYLLYLVGPRSE